MNKIEYDEVLPGVGEVIGLWEKIGVKVFATPHRVIYLNNPLTGYTVELRTWDGLNEFLDTLDERAEVKELVLKWFNYANGAVIDNPIQYNKYKIINKIVIV